MITQQRNEQGIRILFWLCVVVLAVLAGFQPGIAEDQDIEQLHKAAEQGEAAAQHELGFMYAEGSGVPQDYREAVKWFRLAAEQGVPDALFNLGVAYSEGEI